MITSSLAITAFLAFIQSITEFLPISSSGHLILSEKFGISNQSLGVDIALHVGTLIAVVVYFWKDIRQAVESFLYGYQNKKMAYNLIIATIPSLIVGCFWGNIIMHFHTPVIIAGTSIFYGILLWVVDKGCQSRHHLGQMNWAEALCIGAAQTLALVPGTSRSGITMTCCRALGFNRQDSAKFSMLLSIPVIAAAAAYILFQAHQTGTLGQFLNPYLLIGVALSAFFGLIVIWFLMSWVKKASFGIFAAYRVILGLFVLYYFL